MCPPPSLSHKLVLIYWAGFLLHFSIIGVIVSVASWSQTLNYTKSWIVMLKDKCVVILDGFIRVIKHKFTRLI